MDRVKKEKEFHNRVFSAENDIRNRSQKYYQITDQIDKYFYSLYTTNCSQKRVLEYGCGKGNKSFSCAELGAYVTGIDISESGINIAKEEAKKRDLNITFKVMDAENLEFDDNSFDIIVGTAILHHLDLEKSFKELSRVLDEDGHAYFIEPLGHNPIINSYRRRTPSLRTEDEHPLLLNDFKLAQKYFSNVTIKYYYIFSLIAPIFKQKVLFKWALKFLNSLDRFLMTIFPFLKKYAWLVVLDLDNKKTKNDAK